MTLGFNMLMFQGVLLYVVSVEDWNAWIGGSLTLRPSLLSCGGAKYPDPTKVVTFGDQGPKGPWQEKQLKREGGDLGSGAWMCLEFFFLKRNNMVFAS